MSRSKGERLFTTAISLKPWRHLWTTSYFKQFYSIKYATNCKGLSTTVLWKWVPFPFLNSSQSDVVWVQYFVAVFCCCCLILLPGYHQKELKCLWHEFFKMQFFSNQIFVQMSVQTFYTTANPIKLLKTGVSFIQQDQRCPTCSPLATCVKWPFKCDKWLYFRIFQNYSVLTKIMFRDKIKSFQF